MSSKNTNFWTNLERPIKVLAPMAGYTDSAFRLLCCEYGADVVMTELTSADAVAYGKFSTKISKSGTLVEAKNKNNATAELLSFLEKERPVVVQLFGKYPKKFGIAAKWITENLKPDGIDINMGCPARKVVGSDHGAALIKYPKLAAEIVKSVKANTNLPVSVKTRLGWDSDDQILEFAPVLFDAGIDALIIHGRSYKNGFSGEARWKNIFKVKEMFPDKVVIGNGDIGSVTSYELQVTRNQKLGTSNLDGYAIGRATFGKPWIFSKENINSEELKELILKHAKLVFDNKDEHGIVEFRKHLLEYLKGFSNAKALRLEAVKVENIDDIKAIICKI
jgi:nifR3 family TIM-barrel protein